MIVSTNNESAKQELRDYYIKKLEPQHDGNLKYIKEESRKVYRGGDSLYNQGEHQEYWCATDVCPWNLESGKYRY